MATIKLNLNNYVVTDTGEVIVKYKHLVFGLLLMGKSIDGLQTFRCSEAEKIVKDHFHDPKRRESDVEYHNTVCSNPQIIKVTDLDDIAEHPPVCTFEYNLPDKYLELDVIEYLAQRLAEKFPGASDEYVERVRLELHMMQERQMDDLLRALIYIIETFEQNGIVYGVGRGSACASLVLYLIGVHQVDPIEYAIPINDFLR